MLRSTQAFQFSHDFAVMDSEFFNKVDTLQKDGFQFSHDFAVMDRKVSQFGNETVIGFQFSHDFAVMDSTEINETVQPNSTEVSI